MTNQGTPPPGDDIDLTTHYVRGALRGDEDSLEWIIRRFTPVLRAQAEYRLDRRLHSMVDPVDLVNDVWLRALPRLREFAFDGPRSTPPFLRYLSQILLHQVNNLYRKHLRGKPAVISHSDTAAPHPDAFAESARIVSQAIHNEEHDQLTRALRELPDSDREIIILRGVEQNPIHEIAVLLGQKPNTISVRYRRALERLRTQVGGGLLDELVECGGGSMPGSQ